MKKTSNNSTPLSSLLIDEEDEAFFEQYLKGESSLSETYQKVNSPEPPEMLDQNILSAARKKSSEMQKKSVQWWQQPASWAASVAVFSLAALLTHQTWQAEQDFSEQDFAPIDAVETIQADKTYTASPRLLPNDVKEKKRTHHGDNNDSRKLLYKSAPAPVMPAAQEYISRKPIISPPERANKSQTQGVVLGDTVTDDAGRFVPSELSEESVLIEKREQKNNLSKEQGLGEYYSKEQSHQLEKIQQLIKQGKFDEAKEILQQFKVKYPEMPINPVLLQQLSPY